MKANKIAGLLLLAVLGGCHSGEQPQEHSPLAIPGEGPLPYGKWKFAFFTPEGLPALATHARIIDTAGYLYTFNTLDSTQGNPNSIETWSKVVRRSSIHFNQAKQPPQYMVFCWDSIIDKKTYETSLYFPRTVWEKMRTPASYKSRMGRTVWYKTMLLGLAPGGKVKIWLQDVGDHSNYPLPVEKLKTVSGDKLDICKGITQSDFSYGYDQDIKDFIKGKTYPYGNW